MKNLSHEELKELEQKRLEREALMEQRDLSIAEFKKKFLNPTFESGEFLE